MAGVKSVVIAFQMLIQYFIYNHSHFPPHDMAVNTAGCLKIFSVNLSIFFIVLRLQLVYLCDLSLFIILF